MSATILSPAATSKLSSNKKKIKNNNSSNKNNNNVFNCYDENINNNNDIDNNSNNNNNNFSCDNSIYNDNYNDNYSNANKDIAEIDDNENNFSPRNVKKSEFDSKEEEMMKNDSDNDNSDMNNNFDNNGNNNDNNNNNNDNNNTKNHNNNYYNENSYNINNDKHKNNDIINESNFKGIVIGGTYQHCFEEHSPLIAPPLKMDKRVTGIIINDKNELLLKLFLPKDDITKIINLGINWKWTATVPDGFLLSKSPFSARKKLICYYLQRHPLLWAADIEREKESNFRNNDHNKNNYHSFNNNYNSHPSHLGHNRHINDCHTNFQHSQLSSGGSSSLELNFGNFGNFGKFPEFRAPSVTRHFEEFGVKDSEKSGIRGSGYIMDEKDNERRVRGERTDSKHLHENINNNFCNNDDHNYNNKNKNNSKNNNMKTENEEDKSYMIRITNMLGNSDNSDNDDNNVAEIEVEEGREKDIHYVDVEMDCDQPNFLIDADYTETEIETEKNLGTDIYSSKHCGKEGNRGRGRGRGFRGWEDNMDLLEGAVTVGPQSRRFLNITRADESINNGINININIGDNDKNEDNNINISNINNHSNNNHNLERSDSPHFSDNKYSLDNRTAQKPFAPPGYLGIFSTQENVHVNMHRTDTEQIEDDDLMLTSLLTGSNADYNCPQIISYVLEYLLGTYESNYRKK